MKSGPRLHRGRAKSRHTRRGLNAQKRRQYKSYHQKLEEALRESWAGVWVDEDGKGLN